MPSSVDRWARPLAPQPPVTEDPFAGDPPTAGDPSAGDPPGASGTADAEGARPPLRRLPRQRRSADRLERILDACAEILGETGYEALSTRAVAVRAGVPIGSVYRFFGNKRAMADALAHRNLDVYLGRVSDRLAAADEGERPGEGRGGDGLLDWRWAVDVVLDTYVEMKRDTPGFALLDFSVPGTTPVPPTAPEPAPVPDSPSESATAGTTGGGACAPNRLLAERLCALLAEPLGRTPDEALRRTFLVGAQAADVLVRLAFRTDPAGDPAILAETKTLLRAYLTRTLD